MCLDNLKLTKRKKVIGYKVAFKRGSKYYGIYTNALIPTKKTAVAREIRSTKLSRFAQSENGHHAYTTLVGAKQVLQTIIDQDWDSSYPQCMRNPVIFRVQLEGNIKKGFDGLHDLPAYKADLQTVLTKED